MFESLQSRIGGLVFDSPAFRHDFQVFLSSLDPFLAAMPNYAIVRQHSNAHRLPTPGGMSWIAFTSPDLDLQCKDYLAERLEWRGRGFAAVFCSLCEFSYSSHDVVGAIIHEAGHRIAWTHPAVYNARPGSDHGPEWIRATVHLWARAQPLLRANGFRVTFDHVCHSGRPMLHAYVALRDEIQQKWSAPLLSVIGTPPPAEFSALFAPRRPSPAPASTSSPPAAGPAALPFIPFPPAPGRFSF